VTVKVASVNQPLGIRVGNNDGMVGLFLDEPTTWMLMTPAQAKAFAALVIQQAELAQSSAEPEEQGNGA